MSKTFLTLDKKESLEVSDHTIKNAIILQDTAKYAAGNNNFGVATSLMILSIEEIIKAQVLFFQGVGIRVHRIKNANKIFSSHKDKHQVASQLQFLKIIEGFINAWNYKPNKKKYKTDSKLMNTILNGLQDVQSFIEPISLISKSVEQMKGNVEWIEKANDLKNRGFYVDYKGDIKLPQDVTIETFDKASSINKECIDLYRIIKLSFEKITDAEGKEILIQSINNDLLPRIENILNTKIEG